jgi:hypothetical protein
MSAVLHIACTLKFNWSRLLEYDVVQQCGIWLHSGQGMASDVQGKISTVSLSFVRTVSEAYGTMEGTLDALPTPSPG